MAIKVVVEFQAKPGARAELKSLLGTISATHAPDAPGFLGSTVYEVLDNPDGLVEIAEWESAEAQAAAVEQALTTGVYEPVVELVAGPLPGNSDRPAVLASATMRSARGAPVNGVGSLDRGCLCARRATNDPRGSRPEGGH
jgi:quinol monooxygenase YgiN